MAYSANGNYVEDNVIKDRASWNTSYPTLYAANIPGVDTSNTITGNERLRYD